MWRLVAYLLAIVALAIGLSWLADRPGSLVITWQGYEVETSVFRAVVLLAFLVGLSIVLFLIARQLWQSPAAIGDFFTRRRQKRGLDALSSGMIAIGAGDRSLAARYALQARKMLPNEPMTHLLRAQAAQLSGDLPTARRIYEAMLGSPDTEQLGLRGLFLEAQREGEIEAARQFAERAVELNPKLGWPLDALFDIQCRQADWEAALSTLATGRRHGHWEKAAADRRRAVLLTAQAQAAEDADPEHAMTLALEAHGLANDLVPAAAIAGRVLAARGNTPKAVRVLQRTWKHSPHPELATAYAYARLGDSPRDRLDRLRQLAQIAPGSPESAIALATAAIEARDWDVARGALEPLLESRLTQRVCTLMAKVEGEQHGDTGRVREWLARAVNAPRDPAWTADGVVSDIWAPVSPVTGALDAFQWRVPVESLEKGDDARIAEKLEELVQLGTRPDRALAAPAETRGPVPPAARPAAYAAAPDADIVDVVPATAAARPAGAVAPAPPRAEPVKVEVRPVPAQARAAESLDAAKPDVRPKQDPRPRTAPETSGVREPERSDPQATALPSPPKPAPRSAAPEASRPPAGDSGPTVMLRSTAAKAAGVEPRIFVPPRAPDDPGTELAEAGDEARSPLLPPRTATKRTV
jgi:HemY protein